MTNITILPAIDLLDGQCVRLRQGQFSECTVYDFSPLQMATIFAEAGATHIHLVDLSGARQGSYQHLNVIKEIAQTTSLVIQTGGGIRNEADIEMLLSNGANRVMIGSVAIQQPDTVKQWLKKYGPEKIIIALDVRYNESNIPCCVTHAWQEETTLCLWDLVATYKRSGLQHVLCTDVSRDGCLQGPNLELYQQCMEQYPKIRWQASGGVSSFQDIMALKKLNISAAIIGKALYEERLDLGQIFKKLSQEVEEKKHARQTNNSLS